MSSPPLPHARLGVSQHAVLHHSRAQPLPHEAPYTPLIDPSAHDCLQLGPVYPSDISPDICLHDPAHALLPAPLTELVQGIVGTASPPKAIGAVIAGLLVHRFQQHRHRSLDKLVLERGLPDRALPPSSCSIQTRSTGVAW